MAKRSPPMRLARHMILAGTIAAGVIIASLSFISLELAMICTGMFALAGVAYGEARRRQFWEQAASFKFKNLKDEQADLKLSMSDHRREMIVMKNDINKTVQIMDHMLQKRDERSEEPFIHKAARAPQPFETTSMPRAIKPQSPAPKPKRAVVQSDTSEEEFNHISDTVVKELLRLSLSQDRIDAFIQPIVRLPQRQTRMYEVFARIRAKPGLYMPASRYMKVAEQDNLDKKIDHLLLMHCLKTIVENARKQADAAPFMINITEDTLSNGPFMKRLLAFVSNNRQLAERLIFEIRQSEFEDMAPALLEILRGLGKLGCSFSLDHVTDLSMDIQELQDFKIRFVKIDRELLMAEHKDNQAFAKILRLKSSLEANGIGVIVQKIESEEQLRALLDFDIRNAQGYLFGKPGLEGAYKKGQRVRRSSPDDMREQFA